MAATHIRITAKRDGFRRAGVAHSTTPATHEFKAFTADQLADLKAESMLVIEEVEAVGPTPESPDGTPALGPNRAKPLKPGK